MQNMLLVPLVRLERTLLSELDFEFERVYHSATGARERSALARREHAGKSIARRLAAIAQRLGDMDPADRFGAGEVGDGPRDAQHPVKAARRQAHRRRRVGEQLAARLVGRRDAVEQFAVGLGIGAHARAIVALATGARARAATRARDLGAAFGRRRQGQSAALTPATSTWRSMRSSSGPDTRAW